MTEFTEAELALIKRVKSDTQELQESALPAADPFFSLARFGLQRKKREKGEKRSLLPVVFILIFVGILLAAAFLMVMQSLAEQTGAMGTFSGITKQLASSKEFSSILDTAGFGWYKSFLSFYNVRWVISAAVFSVFIVLAGMVFVVDLARRGKNE